jgi:hypothetical protein
VALRPNAGHGLLILEVSTSHTTTHHSRWVSSGRVISSSQRPLSDNTQYSQQTNIHAPIGIRIHDLSRRAAADLRLRPRGHWDQKQDALYRLTCYFKSAVLVSGDVFTYHQEHLTLFTVSGSVHPSCCWVVSHSGHQLAATWVNTTRYCKYSEVLLMMGENIARNM